MIPRELIGPLRAALPDAGLDRATVIGQGWSSTAYCVPDPAGDWALRITQANSGPRYPQALTDEVPLLQALARYGPPTPQEARVLFDDGETVAAAHRLVVGEPLARSHLRGRQRSRLAQQLGELLTRLHAFPRDRALALGVREFDLWEDRYWHMERICSPLLTPRSREWFTGVNARFLAEGGMDGAPRTFVHGDIAPPHLLTGADGTLAGVIDFGDAMVADPALDFAGLLQAYREPFMEQVLAHYGGEVDPHFRRRARYYADVVPVYLVRYGDRYNEGQDRIDGLRQMAARAAAATRRAAR